MKADLLPTQPVQTILSAWRLALLGASAVLGARALVGGLQTHAIIAICLFLSGALPPLLLSRRAALAALVPTAPLLSGLERTGLLNFPDALLLFSSALLIGLAATSCWRARQSPPPADEPAPGLASRPLLLVYGLATLVLLSLLAAALRALRDPSLLDFLWHPSAISYAHPHYWLGAAHGWLVGLLIAAEWLVHRPPTRIWLAPTAIAFLIIVGFFALLQRGWQLPFTPLIWSDARMLTSPYEDIHSLGAIAVALFTGLTASLGTRPVALLGALVAGVGLTLALVVGSWSRSAWLASLISLGLLASLRIPRRWVAVLLVGGGLLLLAGNQAAQSEAWNRNQYLWRLGTLIRFENPLAKDGVRVALYHKAFAMIIDRPWIGHGIGSFYHKSPRYAVPDDPWGSQPNFAHNFLLQFAAEMGVPAAVLLATLIAWALARGYRLAISAPAGDRLAISLTLALTAYLLTQLTANALNIYLSNQLFFWPLWAAVITLPARKAT